MWVPTDERFAASEEMTAPSPEVLSTQTHHTPNLRIRWYLSYNIIIIIIMYSFCIALHQYEGTVLSASFISGLVKFVCSSVLSKRTVKQMGF